MAGTPQSYWSPLPPWSIWLVNFGINCYTNCRDFKPVWQRLLWIKWGQPPYFYFMRMWCGGVYSELHSALVKLPVSASLVLMRATMPGFLTLVLGTEVFMSADCPNCHAGSSAPVTLHKSTRKWPYSGPQDEEVITYPRLDLTAPEWRPLLLEYPVVLHRGSNRMEAPSCW